MKVNWVVVFILFSSVAGWAHSEAERVKPILCSRSSEAESSCLAKISQLRPTQMSVGMHEVREKLDNISKIVNNSSELSHFMKNNPVPAVIGPGGRIYITDHHHLARAFFSLGIPVIICKIQENLSSLSDTDFWNEMSKQGWVYPFDHQGQGPLPYSQLPGHISELQDDVYRDLAYEVRKKGAFEKSSEPFAEFKWANYFRKRIVIEPGVDGLRNAISEGVSLARDSEAADLPGYVGPSHSSFFMIHSADVALLSVKE